MNLCVRLTSLLGIASLSLAAPLAGCGGGILDAGSFAGGSSATGTGTSGGASAASG